MVVHPNMSRFVLVGCFAAIQVLTGVVCFSQCPTNDDIRLSLQALEADQLLNTPQKYEKLIFLKKRSDDCRLSTDSTYARILNRLGFYSFLINNNIPTNASVNYTLAAIRINKPGAEGSSFNHAINNYKNLAFYYRSLSLFDKAIEYLDSTLFIAGYTETTKCEALPLRIDKISIYFAKKDYQKIVDESTRGLLEAQACGDSLMIMRFYANRAQSHFFLGQVSDALTDINRCRILAKSLHDDFELASTFKILAQIAAVKDSFTKADSFFRQCIRLRIKTNDIAQLADDYTDYGNFFLNDLKDVFNAANCYRKTLNYAVGIGNIELQAKANLNLGAVSFYRKDFLQALKFNNEAIAGYAAVDGSANQLVNPSARKLGIIGNNELLLYIFNNKTEILLSLFNQTKRTAYLTASLQTALLMDTLITTVRYQQTGELSKFYWRNKTREFFTNALEACYLSGDARLAFLFMEKSRAVLLNDRLHELGASKRLPEAVAKKQQELHIEIIAAQQQLSLLPVNSSAYETQRSLIIEAQTRLEHYIRSLEKNFPSYYQYKYADKSLTMRELQQYLADRQQSFVHYYLNDTVIYMLGIESDTARLLKRSGYESCTKQIAAFNRYCNDKQTLLSEFPSFAAVSYSLYTILFQPLQLTSERVIICTDNFALPFEALCMDPEAKKYLVSNYAISYMYSARSLFNNVKQTGSKSGFVGFAPVSFKPYLKVTELKHSADFLKQAAQHYDSNELFVGEQATKSNFVRHLSSYGIVNIFSHAVADSTMTEPALYMQDSVIRLSELQVIPDALAGLVVLSACQTNVGKNITGEGMYSLARGFAAVGVPSVAATLWKADEQSTYIISILFHKHLAQRMPKDLALQQAKLDFLETYNHDEKSLPVYWAAMILIGDVNPVQQSRGYHAWMTAGLLGAAAIGILIVYLVRTRRHLA